MDACRSDFGSICNLAEGIEYDCRIGWNTKQYEWSFYNGHRFYRYDYDVAYIYCIEADKQNSTFDSGNCDSGKKAEGVGTKYQCRKVGGR